MPFQAPRGTQDVLPTQSQNWRWLENEFMELARLYGYRELRTPTFEDTELFIRNLGETSDIVSKEMYNFQDKGGRDLTLKPEGTAPAIRAAIEHNLCPQGTVARLSYVTTIFRYARPQKGRYREAHQVGLELIGSPSPAADAEVIEITVRFYERLGLSGLGVLVNSIGRSECRRAYGEVLLKHAQSFLMDQDEEHRATAEKNPLGMLDSKDPGLKEALAGVPPILDFLEDESRARFELLQCLLSEAGVEFTVAPEVVRGLDYYTETVFEVQSSKLGAQSSLCGGGRYDNLYKELGGPPTPSVGVAMGIERALIVMEEEGLGRPPAAPETFVAYTGQDVRQQAFDLARELRAAGISTMIDLDGKSLKSQLRQADKSEAKQVLLIGEDEAKANVVTVRDLATGEQREVPRSQVATSLRAGE
jgi:histidyl-tRNA synthetase